MDLLLLGSKEEYKQHYIQMYCQKEILTYSGILVKFYEDQFEHVFFESFQYKKRDKSIFSLERAQRMNWIKSVLECSDAELYVGWDRDKKKYNYNRRVSIISEDNYVVILNIINDKRAKFITAYSASKSNAKKIRSAPKWKINKDY